MPAAPHAACVAGLTARLGSLQVAGTRSVSSSSSSSHIFASSSSSLPLQTSARPRPQCLNALTAATGRPSQQTASFSTTRPALKSRNFRRTKMRLFFKKDGKALKKFDPEAPLYMNGGVTKYPYNPEFQTMSILSDATRQVIWSRVVQHGEPVKAVAADLEVDMRRVAACVRLKELERSWILQGKPLAKAYTRAIEGMLPTFTLGDEETPRAFEPTNEIASHPYTQQQLFLPVSESRHFTREDASKAFHPTLLSADKRMPIPQLVAVEKHVHAGGGRRSAYAQAAQNFRDAVDQEQVALAAREARAVAAEAARTTKVDTDRFQFRIRDYNAEHVGKTGRSSHAVGWRYGTPYDDRKRGLLKIPSSIG